MLILGQVGVIWAEDDVTDEQTNGYSLDDEWQTAWRRIFDRHGRPDPQGAIQQRFAVRQYPEYEADIAVADFPLFKERAWLMRDTGVRFWIHSYDAVTLGNQAQIKLGVPMSRSWRVRAQFDRYYTMTTQSDLLRMDFIWEPPTDRHPYLAITMFPRVEKQDVDFEGVLGYHDDRFGDVRLRLYVFDAFTNASYALSKDDTEQPPSLEKQQSLPLGAAFELASVRICGFRAEAYAGWMIPQKKKLLSDFSSIDRTQRQSAYLFGGLFEWQSQSLPLILGTTGLLFHSRHAITEFEAVDPDAEPENNRLRELTVQTRGYAIAQWGDLTLEGSVRFTARPEWEHFPDNPSADRRRRDNEWMTSGRGFYWLTPSIGFELGYWRHSRHTSGGPDVFVDAVGNRIVTRFLLNAGKLWASFGTGWDPDPRRSVYAGSGGTLIFEF